MGDAGRCKPLKHKNCASLQPLLAAGCWLGKVLVAVRLILHTKDPQGSHVPMEAGG